MCETDGSNQSESLHLVILSTKTVLETQQVFSTMFMHRKVIPRN